MIQLSSCKRCGGFLALSLRACPHCQAPVARLQQLALGVAGVVGGGAMSMTLMACYGPACVDDVCSGDTGSTPITDAQLQQLQSSLGAGSWRGQLVIDLEADGRECEISSTGSIEAPRRLSVTLTAVPSDLQVDRSLELVADSTPISAFSESGSATISFEAAPEGPRTLTIVRSSAGQVEAVELDSVRCEALRRTSSP